MSVITAASCKKDSLTLLTGTRFSLPLPNPTLQPTSGAFGLRLLASLAHAPLAIEL
ncbi:MAG: hypothetical protein HYR56_02985 [Acidobacteria bacterium]|nr:hypothetical protein [Acidobacteriota bacterium]MBI3423576.1 hypothetical protein [Acidobacteriota bacterium]